MTHSGLKPFACDKCDKRFTLSGNLKQHKMTHTRKKPYACDYFDKSFKSKLGLNFACDWCDRWFTLSGFMWQVIFQPSKFRLSYFDSFWTSDNLKQNKLTDTREKPRACVQCDNRFIESGNLNYHKLIHLNRQWRINQHKYWKHNYFNVIIFCQVETTCIWSEMEKKRNKQTTK